MAVKANKKTDSNAVLFEKSIIQRDFFNYRGSFSTYLRRRSGNRLFSHTAMFKDLLYCRITNAQAQALQISHDKKLTVCSAQQGEETFLLCKSQDRTLKDKAIHTRRKDAFEKELINLRETIIKKGCRKKLSWIYEKTGRVKEKYPVGQHYTIDIDVGRRVCFLLWKPG